MSNTRPMSEEKYRERYGEGAEFVLAFKKKNGNLALPWSRAYCNIRNRCVTGGDPRWAYYGGRGIQMRITSSQLRELFFRDKAYLMDRPSVDRIDNDGHYEPSNIRWVELSQNVRERWFGKPARARELAQVRTVFSAMTKAFGWTPGMVSMAARKLMLEHRRQRKS